MAALLGRAVYGHTLSARFDLATASTLNGVIITRFLGVNCAGTLTGSYDQSTGGITFLGATIPSNLAAYPCRITGRVQLSPTVTFTNP